MIFKFSQRVILASIKIGHANTIFSVYDSMAPHIWDVNQVARLLNALLSEF
jgi:hypothetical protein